jgi:hypothetical protein
MRRPSRLQMGDEADFLDETGSRKGGPVGRRRWLYRERRWGRERNEYGDDRGTRTRRQCGALWLRTHRRSGLGLSLPYYTPRKQCPYARRPGGCALPCPPRRRR